MSNPTKKNTNDDEVEQLLRAAQDDILLKLNLNSHMARASASAAIDPDLDRRFEALKRPQKSTKIGDPVKKVPARTDSATSSEVVGADGDLLARFAALKNSIPSNNSNGMNRNFPIDVSVNQEVKEEESADEVEKVIKWAIDAARLDPSPPSEDDDDDDDDNHDSDEFDDDDDKFDSGKKGKIK